ncbi:adenylyltransferase and sulfurtransferase [Moraxella cuniculi DSM 21768]|uniref:Adenylyltransferase and sulfurtransferase n=1 Tax=Moraxella cuniculi DSM 21768 TaxID=1122245 RepID=A0A1N7EH07_9GAMM|nr:HesA/MoeB/ThiF family protein [Moraxella cuniculi]OOS07295.1 molybdopterin biosynthesis protein [Moraxella cuniculi]SIR87289.1 adenylyltransferase and sulfurtransferase [Moraxella cuniculi DSM 21768]
MINQQMILSDDELMRYSRQILLDEWDLPAQIRLKNSHAIIVGMGGLGCPIAQILVRSGIGRLTIIDNDTVEASNLQRQLLYTSDDIGRAKVEVAKEKLHKENGFCCIDTSTEQVCANWSPAYLSEVDLLIDCTDNFVVRDVLNTICRRRGVPLLSTAAIAQTGQVALYTAQTGCYQCVFADEGDDEQNCANSGVLASTVAVIGAMAAQLALVFLAKGINPIANQLMVWQGATMRLQHYQFYANPDCAVCALTD